MSSYSAYPKETRSLLIEEHGGPEVIQEKTMPVPALKDDEILIKVSYAGVNFIDTYFRKGLYKPALPFTLGQESAGTVVAVASKMPAGSSIKVGDRVAGYTGGSYSEYQVANFKNVDKVPEGVSFKTAAGIMVQGLTALTMLKESYAVKKGDWILVHAAAGGVGLNLCQIASHFGVNVIGTTSTEEKAALAKSAGASHVIVGRAPDYLPALEAEVLRLTNGNGVEGIFDGVGLDTWESDFKVLRRKGTLVTFGNASGAAPAFQALKLAGGNWKVVRPTLNNYVATAEEFHSYTDELFQLLKDGVVKLNIFNEYPFSAEGLKKAHEDLTGRVSTGKLVIKIADEA